MRFLYKCRVLPKREGFNFTCVSMNPDVNKTPRSFILRCTVEQLPLFLRRIRAKDSALDPASYRGKTYLQIAQEIVSGTDNIIFVWSNHLPKKEGTVVVESFILTDKDYKLNNKIIEKNTLIRETEE